MYVNIFLTYTLWIVQKLKICYQIWINLNKHSTSLDTGMETSMPAVSKVHYTDYHRDFTLLSQANSSSYHQRLIIWEATDHWRIFFIWKERLKFESTSQSSSSNWIRGHHINNNKIRFATSQSSNCQSVLTRLCGSCSRSKPLLKLLKCWESNPQPLG